MVVLEIVRNLVLMIVVVAETVGAEDHLHVAVHGLDGGIVAAVGHHHGALHGAAVQNFVPADDGLPALAQIGVEMLHEVVLQVIHALQPELRRQLLAVVALAPGGLGAFVAADMVIGRGEELQYLVKDILEELEGFG